MHVANTGLTQAQAKEEFRRERRIALYLRGVAFYDARRWGIIALASAGGGRAYANVLVPGDLIGSSAATIVPCFIDYNFVDFRDVSQNELDLNVAQPGSAPVKTKVICPKMPSIITQSSGRSLLGSPAVSFLCNAGCVTHLYRIFSLVQAMYKLATKHSPVKAKT